MKHLFKRVISMLLAATVICGVAVAGGADWLKVTSHADGPQYMGKCGENADWYYMDGYLWIEGNGQMDAYFEEKTPAPWNDLKNEITTVEISEGITNVSSKSFSECKNLTRISIPRTVKTIDRSAFQDCSKLSEVYLTYGLDKIDSWAFSGCTSLKNITLPSSLHEIGRESFGYCGFKNLVVPDSVYIMSRDAFCGCEDLESVTLPKTQSEISRGLFCGCSKLKKIDLPNWITNIGRDAFDGCTSLQEINIPDSVETIGMTAFYGCTNLNKIKMSTRTKEIGEDAFVNTGYYNNKSNWEDGVLYVDDHLISMKNDSATFVIKDGTRCVARNTFENCKNLTNIIVPASVKSFSSFAIRDCNKLNKMIFTGRAAQLDESFASNKEKITFYCYSDSAVASFAKEKGIKCIMMDGLMSGDASGDKKVNSTDALKVLQFTVGQITDINETYPAMDVNVDGNVNSKDALDILRFTVGMIDHFNCLSATNADFDILEDIIRESFWTTRNGFDYNCNQEDAFTIALDIMIGSLVSSVTYMIFDDYGWENSYEVIEAIEKADPRGAYNYMYTKFDGEKFDKILKEVFNVTPDHDYVAKHTNEYIESGKDVTILYYENGFYYMASGQGGDGAYPETQINSVEKSTDGKYKINITYMEKAGYTEDYLKRIDTNVITELKNVDGEKIWSIYSIEKCA